MPPRAVSARLPPAVLPGARVGVAALSGPAEAERIDRGLAALRRLGFEPILADNLYRREGLFAGGDDERLDAFHRLAARPDLAAIFFIRGGYGVMRLLDRLDWELLGRHPRAYIGYSDLSPFLLSVVERLGWVTFHGPMVAADLARGLSPTEEASLLDALAGRYPQTLELAVGGSGAIAEGPLLGGCLSMLTALLGTDYFPSLDGSILFWEEIDEPLYRLDRMLTHLRLSGRVECLSAMIVGHVTCRSESAAARWSSRLEGALAEYPWPIAWGLECGHVAPNRTLPLGLMARLEGTAGRLLLGEV
ncbi:MAG: LD-carboxypeptidase [Acidobacteriota bacterium]